MNVLVCIKRVPDTGAKFEISDDGQTLVTRNMEFTVSPHEECAVEEAIRLVEGQGGQATALTLGEEASTEQLREALAKGAGGAILIETDGGEWDAGATASTIAETVEAQPAPFDVLLFGNEAADTGDYQVGVRVAARLGLPCVTGIKSLEIEGSRATAKRESSSGWEVYDVELPAVFTVKEGINVPRHPSLRGIMAAKKIEIQRIHPTAPPMKMKKRALRRPQEKSGEVQILGQGPEAADKIVEVLANLGVLSS